MVFSGEVATNVSATEQTYTGWTYDASYTGNILTGTIQADGSTVLKLYYKINKYMLRFEENG